jgi:hypothetical protein
MFTLFRWLTQALGSPKEQKSDQMAIAVMFTTFLGFVVTMTVIVTMGRSAIQLQPTASQPRDICSSIAERLPALTHPTAKANTAPEPDPPASNPPSQPTDASSH